MELQCIQMVSEDADRIHGLGCKNFTKTRRKQIGKWYTKLLRLSNMGTTSVGV